MVMPQSQVIQSRAGYILLAEGGIFIWSDPEEINDINSSSSAVANELRGELLDKLGPYITS